MGMKPAAFVQAAEMKRRTASLLRRNWQGNMRSSSLVVHVKTCWSAKATRSAEDTANSAMTVALLQGYRVPPKLMAITRVRMVMQQAWAIVLDLPCSSLGSNSDFLASGGDSIAAINIASECRQLGYSISVSSILSKSVLADQAKELRQSSKTAAVAKAEYSIPSSVDNAIKGAGLDQSNDIESIYPCGPGQSEFLTQGSEKEQSWNLLACRELPADLDLDAWKCAVTSLTARNQILRATYWRVAGVHASPNWYQVSRASRPLQS